MAQIVLIHGIAQEQETADGLESTWLPSLAGGLRKARFDGLADAIWRAARPGGLDVRMAFYGDVWLEEGQQGDRLDLEAGDESVLADELAAEWLTRARDVASDPEMRREAMIELAAVRGVADAQAQGPGAVVRRALNGVARLPWFSRVGMAFAERFVVRALAQVSTYLSRPELREQVQETVLRYVDEGTRAIIAHSLGSVVAYEVAHRLDHPLPLLVTLGSPLGLRSIVYERVKPQPPRYPSRVKRWVNVADRDDVVAAEPDLTPMFGDGMPAGARFEGGYTVDNGAEPHNARFYLGKEQVGRAVGEALSGS